MLFLTFMQEYWGFGKHLGHNILSDLKHTADTSPSTIPPVDTWTVWFFLLASHLESFHKRIQALSKLQRCLQMKQTRNVMPPPHQRNVIQTVLPGLTIFQWGEDFSFQSEIFFQEKCFPQLPVIAMSISTHAHWSVNTSLHRWSTYMTRSCVHVERPPLMVQSTQSRPHLWQSSATQEVDSLLKRTWGGFF